MAEVEALPGARDVRERVRFYLLDHRTPVGRGIDIALCGLKPVFVGIFVAKTYRITAASRALLWRLEVAIALVLLVEYVLRVYGAESRLSEVFDPYTVVDLFAFLPTLSVLVLPVSVVALNIGFFRVLRVVRVLRFYRFTRDGRFFFGTVSLGTL